MAIKKLKSGSFQARLLGIDGRTLTKAFASRLEAEEQVLRWKREKKEGTLRSRDVRRITLDAFFTEWFAGLVASGSNSGWRKHQLQHYRDYVSPLIGAELMTEIRPRAIQRVLLGMAERGKAPSTQSHVFSLLHKMYSDAMDTYEYVSFNPVIRKLRPRIIVREAPHLNRDQASRLAQYVQDRKYGTAILLQLFTGLRVGEVQGLRWEDLDLSANRLTVRRVYVRKANAFRDYPKGGKQRVQPLPRQLVGHLKKEQARSTVELVAPSQKGKVLPYRWYGEALARYCRELGLPEVGTHGLRHSTAELYISQGASHDDVRQLLGHASSSTTVRYMHGRNVTLDKVSNVIELFLEKKNTKTEHEDRFSSDRLSN
jgi:integrase